MILRILPLVFLLLLASPGCEFDQGPLSEAAGMFERAVVLYNENSYRQAETLFVQSLAVFEQHGETRPLAEVHRYLGQISLVDGKLYTGLQQFQTALRYAKEGRDFRSEMALDALIGDAQLFLGRTYEASASYRAARQLGSAFNDLGFKAEVERKLARSAFLSGNDDEALLGYQSALSYIQSTGDNAEAAALLASIGEVYNRQGRYSEALNSLTQARTLIDRLDVPGLDARLRMNIGLSLKYQGNLNDALQQFRDAANLLRTRRVDRDYEVLLLFHIGSVYFESQRTADAKRYFEEGSELARSMGDRIAGAYQRLLAVQCDVASIPQPQRVQSVERVIASYEQTAGQFREAGHRAGEAFCYAQQGKYYVSVGNTEQALRRFRAAVQLEEGTLREFLRPEFHTVYQSFLHMKKARQEWATDLAGLLMQMNKPDEALLLLDRASSKPLFESFQDVQVAIRHPEVKTEVALARTHVQDLNLLQIELSSLRAYQRSGRDESHIASLQSRIDRLRSDITALATRVVSVHPNYEPLLQLTSLSLREVQQAIPRGTLVVRFLPAQEQLHIFAISRNRFEVKSTVLQRGKLMSLVEEYQRLMQDPSVYTGTGGEESVPVMTRFATLSSQLYDYLLRPVDGLLERNLVIIMSPEFEYFPFHTIERQERNGGVKYLVEITSVDYLPSLASLRFKTASAPRLNAIVALGNPTGKNWSIDYELRDIRSFFKDARILISMEATWENLAPARADVLQLSTEFSLNEGASFLGSLAVSDGKTLGEAINVPYEKLSELPAVPVVLLSNQVGQGIGLSMAHAMLLRINGTSDVFLNAWHADRKASKFFSEFFYTHLSNGLAPGDAYRQALLNLIRTKEVSHPHSWGQFFHFGVG